MVQSASMGGLPRLEDDRLPFVQPRVVEAQRIGSGWSTLEHYGRVGGQHSKCSVISRMVGWASDVVHRALPGRVGAQVGPTRMGTNLERIWNGNRNGRKSVPVPGPKGPETSI